MTIELQPGEQELGSWSVFHEPAGRRAISGDLHVTDKRILFDAKMEAGGRAAKQALQSLKSGWKAANSLAIDRGQVTNVDSRKSFLSKKVMVSTADGATHVFNRGMMSVDPIVEALQQR